MLLLSAGTRQPHGLFERCRSRPRSALRVTVDFGSATRKVVLVDEAGDGSGDLVATMQGRLDRVGVVAVLIADQSKIEDRPPPCGGFLEDDFVDLGRSGAREPLEPVIGKARI